MRSITALFLVAALVLPATSQTVDVTFRHVRSSSALDWAFVPGSFNGWGVPYEGGNACIARGHESQMEFVLSQGQWIKTISLPVGQQVSYKIQVQREQSGVNDCEWLTDPLNPDTDGSSNTNSVLTPSDPMIFQVGEELTPSGTVNRFSAGIFGSEPFTEIRFSVNGVESTNGLDHFDPATGIFRYDLERSLLAGVQFSIEATDASGDVVSAEIGEIQSPIEWAFDDYATVETVARVRGFITRLDGTVDPAITEATVLNGGSLTTIPVTDGRAEGDVFLLAGDNSLIFEAEVDGQLFQSDTLVVTKRLHPLQAFLMDAQVSGSDFAFDITLVPRPIAPDDLTVEWELDDQQSTVAGTLAGSGLQASGAADGEGELYVDVIINSDGQEVDRLRVAVRIAADGSVTQMAFDQNAEWTKRAVVYEIFPLMFGPRARGTATAPGNRLNEITDELDYIADMGFNTIWFMPIMQALPGDQSPIGAGYNIVDFMNVDHTLGTNEDFRALVDRAHELGIRIVLDITPNHASQRHPWTESLREDGPYADYIQTTPSSHGWGQDNRGANLPEIWQTENGQNLYRKYDGFGDLANLNWNDDDLQADFLDILAYWIREYDIDGYRMDVWWGPLRRYGAARFARPVREMVKRLKPDAWLLGEIVGTGFTTEVYYAESDNGEAVVGGLDAAYDWPMFWDAFVNARYGNVQTYHNRAYAFDFWPGPESRYFRFLENHDEERIAYRHRSNPDRIKPLTGLLLTTTGIPLIYAGQEVNFGDSHSYAQRDAVDWETERNGEFAELHQRLAHARGQFPAFGTQELIPLLIGREVGSLPWAYAFARPYQDENAVVVINFDDEPVDVTIDPSNDILWSTDGPIPYYDIAADTSNYHLDQFTVTIPPYETVVYITSDDPGFDLPPMPSLPYGAVNTASEAQESEVPGEYMLHAAYPNPFNPTTRIEFEIPEATDVRLEVFDLLGRRVASLVDGFVMAGFHTALFEASQLPSGSYLYRLVAGNHIESKSITLVK